MSARDSMSQGRPPAIVVALVDDNDINRYVISRALERAGFEVREGGTGAEALQLAGAGPDLLILDLNLPDIDGFEVCRRLRESPATSRLPILHVTASMVTTEAKVLGLEGGADGFLVAPVKPEELVATVNSILRLRRAEERWRLAAEAARMFAFDWDLESDLTHASPESLQVLGMDIGRSVPRAELDARMHDEDRDVVRRRVTGLSPQDPGYHVAYRWRRSDGSWMTLEEIGRGRYDASGRLIRVFGMITDITERRRMEDELAKTNSILRAVSETTHDLIFVKDLEGRFLFANPACLTAIGRPSQEVLGGQDADWATESEALAFRITDQRIMRSGKSEVVEEELTGPDGKRTYLSTKTPLRDESGEIVGLVGVSTDITDRKGMERELQNTVHRLHEADRLKDEFLAMLSHELRGPLGPIRNAVHVLKVTHAKGETLPPQSMTWSLDVIDRQVTHLVRLVDDLLDISRITRGKITLRREPVAVADLVKGAVELARPAIDARNHTFTIDVESGPLRVLGDATRLVQVIGNLLDNSSKYTEPGGRLQLRAREQAGSVVIAVQDNGMGISPQLLPRIFDLFTQDERTIDRARGGLGIGLSLVHRLVEMHGGTVEARSDGPGKGSEFVLRLPLIAP